MARETKYLSHIHPDWAASLAMEGLTDKEIAVRMKIAKSTLYKWSIEHPEFSDSLKISKDPANARVKQSLFKRACGYIEKEKKIIIEMDKEGNQKPARIETIEKAIPADVGAICFFLKNRLPDEFRDKRDFEITANPFMDLMKAATAVDEQTNGE